MMLKRFWKNAFTMIELLVTVSIIVLLAAMLLPSLNRAREKANCARCGFNLKQLYQASMTFASEYGELPYAASAEYKYAKPDGTYWWAQWPRGWVDWRRYPASYPDQSTPPATHDVHTYWWGTNAIHCITNGTISSFVGREQRVYFCPTFASRIKYVNPWTGAAPYRDVRRSYVMNAQLSGANVINHLGTSSASRRMLFADGSFLLVPAAGGIPGANRALGPSADYSDPATVTSGRKHYRGIDGELTATNDANVVERIGNFHDGRANCVFVDGHIEKLLYSNTIAVCSGNWGE